MAEEEYLNRNNEIPVTRNPIKYWLNWLDEPTNQTSSIYKWPFDLEFFSRVQLKHFIKCILFFVLAGFICHASIRFEYEYCTGLMNLSVWLWSGSYVCEAASRMAYY